MLTLVVITCLQEWVWQQEHTTGSLPLGVYYCGFTVVGSRVLVFGSGCGHDACYHNSLHELDTTILNWKRLAPNEAEGAPIKKCACGVVAHSIGGVEQLFVFGGYGRLNSASHQTTAEYVTKSHFVRHQGDGWTNEFHCFTSGENTQYNIYCVLC